MKAINSANGIQNIRSHWSEAKAFFQSYKRRGSPKLRQPNKEGITYTKLSFKAGLYKTK